MAAPGVALQQRRPLSGWSAAVIDPEGLGVVV
jgi:hypothetical protein